VLVGVGAVGALVAPILARAGLKVVGLEAGPYRTRRDFVPDELNSSYYARGAMGPKFLSETPRWRLREDAPTREATYTLGRMMNTVGGSVIHWGGALRRCHPHHFRYLTHVRESFGDKVLPEGHTLADWPVTYDDLEPYYTEVEYLAGVAGDGDANPFVPRSKPYPMPPMRPFRTGRRSAKPPSRWACTLTLRRSRPTAYPTTGSRPTPTPPGAAPGSGRTTTTGGTPALTCSARGARDGNFDLRTHCRVVRVLTGADGRARGVEYVDAAGECACRRRERSVLCGYTFENCG
jgi:gluconate 2-dehydrogenase alpha chain